MPVGPMIAECQFLSELLDLCSAAQREFAIYLADYFGAPAAFEGFMRATAGGVLEAAERQQGGDRPLVLKNPELTPHFARLADWDPQARFLVCLRDPRDTVAALIRVQARLRTLGQDSDLRRIGRDPVGLVRFIESYYAGLETVPAERLLTVRLEDLVTRPQAEGARIAAWLGLACDLEVFAGGGARPADARAFSPDRSDTFARAYWSPHYARGPSSAALGTYRGTLSAAEIKAVEGAAAGLNARFPYW
ncbi:hypothetical protein AY600_13835 [Phormidium willei BDU 130791]|nr:hypothetical protein AY600_13835 [Phormidium willei BDU 130791]